MVYEGGFFATIGVLNATVFVMMRDDSNNRGREKYFANFIYYQRERYISRLAFPLRLVQR